MRSSLLRGAKVKCRHMQISSLEVIASSHMGKNNIAIVIQIFETDVVLLVKLERKCGKHNIIWHLNLC